MNRLIVLTILLFAACSFAGGIKWVAFSDIHYGADYWTWDEGTNSYGSISNEVNYAQTNYSPTFFLTTGDIAEATVSGSSCVTNWLYLYIRDMQFATAPHYQLPGNHDAPSSGNLSCWLESFQQHYVWTNGNYVFLTFQTYIGGTNDVIVDNTELDYVENTITNSIAGGYTNFIVATHFGAVPDAVFGSVEPGFGLERLTNILSTYHVVLYMHGHTHTVDPSTNRIPNTDTLEMLVPSLTRSLVGRGMYQVFSITNNELVSTRYRTDTEAAVASVTNIVPMYYDVWPPVAVYQRASNILKVIPQ